MLLLAKLGGGTGDTVNGLEHVKQMAKEEGKKEGRQLGNASPSAIPVFMRKD